MVVLHHARLVIFSILLGAAAADLSLKSVEDINTGGGAAVSPQGLKDGMGMVAGGMQINLGNSVAVGGMPVDPGNVLPVVPPGWMPTDPGNVVPPGWMPTDPGNVVPPGWMPTDPGNVVPPGWMPTDPGNVLLPGGLPADPGNVVPPGGIPTDPGSVVLPGGLPADPGNVVPPGGMPTDPGNVAPGTVVGPQPVPGQTPAQDPLPAQTPTDPSPVTEHQPAAAGEEKAPDYETAYKGGWELVSQNSGVSAMHMQLMYNNKAILFDATTLSPAATSFPPGHCRPDPKNNTKQDCWVHAVEYDINTAAIRNLMVITNPWCASGALSPDGVLVQTGGWNDGGSGVRYMDTCPTCDWEEYPTALAAQRWYMRLSIASEPRGLPFRN